ncbi:DUF1403 family protein [Mesorhizobium sp. M1396]|uniref:ABC transporter permease n=1 Tax=Mesorhizobium sp. M1396 TaxID=2957095 RepID=UPI0033360BFC
MFSMILRPQPSPRHYATLAGAPSRRRGHQHTRRDGPTPRAVGRRLALSAAAARAKQAGRVEDESALRDAVLLIRPGDNVVIPVDLQATEHLVISRDTFIGSDFAQSMPHWLAVSLSWALNAVPKLPTLSNVNDQTPFWEHVWKVALPAITLTLVIVAHMMRMTRAAIINMLASPYIDMARLKGMSPIVIVLKHALPNAWAPIVTVVAFNLAYLIVGVVVVEVVFVYPGIGQLMVDAVKSRDVPVVQACALIFAATYILLNLIADIISIATNPRLLHPR